MPRPTIIMSVPLSIADCGSLYCCPRPSPPLPSLIPGVICTRLWSGQWSAHWFGFTLMKPITKSLFCSAMAAAALVYSPVAMVPSELISARSSKPRPFSIPASLRPWMMPGPGTMCAFTMSAHEEILYTPPENWDATVFPMSANFLSSKMRKLCFFARPARLSAVASSQSSRMSTWVLMQHTWGPTASAIRSSRSRLVTSTATERLLRLAVITWYSFFRALFWAWTLFSSYVKRRGRDLFFSVAPFLVPALLLMPLT
mmetsp:Transcript_8922/g.22927  ORF Transcript_8922/g.22927 Transcript_8922/m.22927 type:complete len:257 (-) Transcript_8922:946-1716(-)